jgi:hypothetical protein
MTVVVESRVIEFHGRNPFPSGSFLLESLEEWFRNDQKADIRYKYVLCNRIQEPSFKLALLSDNEVWLASFYCAWVSLTSGR